MGGEVELAWISGAPSNQRMEEQDSPSMWSTVGDGLWPGCLLPGQGSRISQGSEEGNRVPGGQGEK